MAYQLTISHDADMQLRSLPVHDQRIVENGILARLQHQPIAVTKAVKRLRLNPFAEFELRLGDFRVLYNVDAAKQEVVILAVGQKVGNKLVIGGEEFHGHESNPTP